MSFTYLRPRLSSMTHVYAVVVYTYKLVTKDVSIKTCICGFKILYKLA